MAAPHPDLAHLEPFVGAWNTSGEIFGGPSEPSIRLHGTDRYSWLAGSHFLVHQANVHLGAQASETLELIGYDPDARAFSMHYFDSEGQSGRMLARVSGKRWEFLGETLKFTGGFDAEDRVFSGRWEQRTGNGWAPLMDIRLERTQG